MNDGYVKLYRKTLDNPIITNDNDYFRVWIQLLLMANHSSRKVLFGNETVDLKPGELVTGREELARKCNISSSKVERILKRLKIEHQIEQQTCSKGRLISIQNWKVYQVSEQQNEQQVNNEWTTSEQQVNTNKNDNNIKNEIIIKKEKNIEKKKKNIYGEFKNVLLSDDELEKLKQKFLDYELRIEKLSGYIASKGDKYKSHYATILNWARNDKTELLPSWYGKEFEKNEMSDIEKEELEKMLEEFKE